MKTKTLGLVGLVTAIAATELAAETTPYQIVAAYKGSTAYYLQIAGKPGSVSYHYGTWSTGFGKNCGENNFPVIQVTDFYNRDSPPFAMDMGCFSPTDDRHPILGYSSRGSSSFVMEGRIVEEAVLAFYATLQPDQFLDVSGLPPKKTAPKNVPHSPAGWAVTKYDGEISSLVSYDFIQIQKKAAHIDPKNYVTVVGFCAEACNYQIYDQTTGTVLLVWYDSLWFPEGNEKRKSFEEILPSLVKNATPPLLVNSALLDPQKLPADYPLNYIKTHGEGNYAFHEYGVKQ